MYVYIYIHTEIPVRRYIYRAVSLNLSLSVLLSFCLLYRVIAKFVFDEHAAVAASCTSIQSECLIMTVQSN